uniref:Uncharacterized protein n=1 Tax=Anguilla anguilla TaxID=7936 RepID=A0A0E9XSI1_ANGAN
MCESRNFLENSYTGNSLTTDTLSISMTFNRLDNFQKLLFRAVL